ncbi:hypothetical protein AXF42_Ash009688 [Apostasia shenzhenica]|uniref:Uncharacterized protein n=1 Tax=Apostasia shenzhenica TaxID=1088818 RepID=A0A2I0AWS7_9ASPA|nr:hypothetical protein AXF42_Ash009688 [Apostasia shenzhenica]
MTRFGRALEAFSDVSPKPRRKRVENRWKKSGKRVKAATNPGRNLVETTPKRVFGAAPTSKIALTGVTG